MEKIQKALAAVALMSGGVPFEITERAETNAEWITRRKFELDAEQAIEKRRRNPDVARRRKANRNARKVRASVRKLNTAKHHAKKLRKARTDYLGVARAA